MLVEETYCTFKKYLSTSHWDKLEEHQAKIFHSLVLRGNLQTVLRWITDKEKVWLMHLSDACSNKLEPVLVVIRGK